MKISIYKDLYYKELIPKLMKEFDLKNRFTAPIVEKIVVSMSSSDIVNDKKTLTDFIYDMKTITGQKPLVTKSKHSISNFKLRKNNEIGVKVTLRGVNMYNFLYKLTNIVLPRIRDFRGLSRNAFDKNYNYNIGIKEQIAFPEIKLDKIKKIRGLNISIVMNNSKTKDHSIFLLKEFNLPFARK